VSEREIHALLVTGASAPPAAVVPVLAALEAAGMRVRAIDGGSGDGAVDRVLRVLRGEERRLLRELETNPPDVAICFEPATAQALSMARDQAANPAPVLAVVAELAPVRDWAATDADRYLVVDDEAAVTLADAGVEGERILVAGPFGERGFVDAARSQPAELRQRFKIAGDPVVLIDVGGFGYDLTAQLALQLSLISGIDGAGYVFDAGGDTEAAQALRHKVPALGLRAKLFGQTPDAPLFWRAADVVVARPRPRAVTRALLLGRRFVAFAPDGDGEGGLAKALESRKLGVTAASALLLAGALEAALRAGSRSLVPGPDGAANAADVAWVVGTDRRAVLDERRAAAREETRAKVREVTRAAEAAARAAAPPGDLEDLGGDDAVAAAAAASGIPDKAEIDRLRGEVAQRMGQVEKAMAEARSAAESFDQAAAAERARGADEEARDAERKADAERARMHAQLGELGRLQEEQRALDSAARAAAQAAAAAPPPRPAAAPEPPPPRPAPSPPRSSASGGRAANIDDELARLKRGGSAAGPGSSGPGPSGPGPSGPSASRPAPKPSGSSSKKPDSSIEDQLTALKREMAAKQSARTPPGQKKP
jgi:hypothetical protein